MVYCGHNCEHSLTTLVQLTFIYYSLDNFLREDSFFDRNDTERSNADEVLENVVLKVQREPEEKKIPYISRIYENSVFEQEVSADLGDKIIKSAEQLTYQQFCILSLVGKRENTEEFLRDFQFDFSLELSKLLHDCFELVTNGYTGWTYINSQRTTTAI